MEDKETIGRRMIKYSQLLLRGVHPAGQRLGRPCGHCQQLKEALRCLFVGTVVETDNSLTQTSSRKNEKVLAH